MTFIALIRFSGVLISFLFFFFIRQYGTDLLFISDGYANVELTSKGREQYNNDGEFRETITENVENYVMANSTSSRLSKVNLEFHKQ